jgi:hypothetical protein
MHTTDHADPEPLAGEPRADDAPQRRYQVGDTVRVTASGLGSHVGVVYEIDVDPNGGFYMYAKTAPHEDDFGNTVSTTFARLHEDHTPRFGYTVELIEAGSEHAELIPTADLPCEHTTAHHGIAGTELVGCDECGATWPFDAMPDQTPTAPIGYVIAALGDWVPAVSSIQDSVHATVEEARAEARRLDWANGVTGVQILALLPVEDVAL